MAAINAILRAMSHPAQIESVTVLTKANIYFDGKVISHTVLLPNGTKQTLGLIYAGTYHFGTDKPEQMDIVAGECKVVLDGGREEATYAAGTTFKVPGKSGFNITVASGIVEYICSYL